MTDLIQPNSEEQLYLVLLLQNMIKRSKKKFARITKIKIDVFIEEPKKRKKSSSR